MFERAMAIREKAIQEEIDKRLDRVEWPKVRQIDDPHEMREEIGKMMTNHKNNE